MGNESLWNNGPLISPPENPYQFPGTGFNVARQPNKQRPTLVVVSARIAVNVAGDDGQILINSDNNNPPLTEVAKLRYSLAAGTGADIDCVTFLVAAGDFYELVTGINAGAPTFTLTNLVELTL